MLVILPRDQQSTQEYYKRQTTDIPSSELLGTFTLTEAITLELVLKYSATEDLIVR